MLIIKKSTVEDDYEIRPSSNKISIALVGDMSNVTVTIKQTDGADGWNPVVIAGVTQVLDVNNTITAVYAPVRLRLFKSAGSNCGVAIHNEKTK